MRNFNLDQLQTLIAIADLGTLAAAARALHLAPPTVSLHISELEQRLGADLVVRGRRQATLTSAGREMVRGGRLLLAAADDLADQVRRRAAGGEGVVRLGTSAGVSPQLLPPVLEALARQCPGIDVKLEVLGSVKAMARLQGGTLDIGIVAMPQVSVAGVALTPWRHDPMVAFIPAGWDLPERVTPEWLAARNWLSFSPSTQMYRLIAGWLGQGGQNPRPRIELNYPPALKSLVMAGHGVALLPLESPDEPELAGVALRHLSPPLIRPMSLACRNSAPPDAAVSKVLQVLETFAALPH